MLAKFADTGPFTHGEWLRRLRVVAQVPPVATQLAVVAAGLYSVLSDVAAVAVEVAHVALRIASVVADFVTSGAHGGGITRGTRRPERSRVLPDVAAVAHDLAVVSRQGPFVAADLVAITGQLPLVPADLALVMAKLASPGAIGRGLSGQGAGSAQYE